MFRWIVVFGVVAAVTTAPGAGVAADRRVVGEFFTNPG